MSAIETETDTSVDTGPGVCSTDQDQIQHGGLFLGAALAESR